MTWLDTVHDLILATDTHKIGQVVNAKLQLAGELVIPFGSRPGMLFFRRCQDMAQAFCYLQQTKPDRLPVNTQYQGRLFLLWPRDRLPSFFKRQKKCVYDSQGARQLG